MDDRSGIPVDCSALLRAWHLWRGTIDCAASRQVWTADTLRSEADILETQLRSWGVGSGARLGVALPNTAAFPVTLMAILQAGCHPVLLPATARPAELDTWGRSCRLHSIIAPVSTDGAGGRSASIGPLPIELVRSLGGSDGSETSQPGILHGTSGTYGRASFCLRNQQVAVAEAENFLGSIDCYDGGRVVITTPMSHAYAYGFGLVTSLLTHSTLVLDSVFNPRSLLAREGAFPSQILALVPPMARVLAHLGSPDRIPPHVFFAGAACPPETAKIFRASFGVELNAIYGTTETGAIASSYGSHADPSCVGPPLGGVDVILRNQSEYESIGPDVGEVFVGSTSMMQGYVDVETRWGPDGGFGTGDLARLDDSGHLHLVGRIKDMINLGGMKVDPAVVERVLTEHPQVLEAAVYPGLRPSGEEFVQAAVTTTDGPLDTAELKAHCAAKLDAFRVPTAFHPVDKLPRTASGKCLKISCPGYPEGLRT